MILNTKSANIGRQRPDHNDVLTAHFTVTGENEDGDDLVLIQPFLLYYINHVVLYAN